MSESTSYVEVKMGSERSFGWVFAAVFAIIAGLAYYKSGKILYWSVGVAVVLGVITLIKPSLFKPFNFVWFKFGMLLGHIIAPLVMMLIFFLVVTPIGLLMRLFGKDPLRLKRKADQNTYWITRPPESSDSSMKNQF
ncbi:MAG: hypothetical protein COA42_10575 [Alteromonadaceae bacterium]|nr:MAG: hypothetical protein COA42_10575 [Alteromonadaceae bacterium]